MPHEPETKRAMVFIDGQNLYHHSREAFGYSYPNYDVLKLAQLVCRNSGWNLERVHFYTGIPDEEDNAQWHRFWAAKLLQMSRQGVKIFSRALRYRTKIIKYLGTSIPTKVGEEKGIDVRIALDIIRLALRRKYDVAVVFSQDQDLSEVAKEIRQISKEQNRWIKMACAFPVSEKAKNTRGIMQADWIPISKDQYDTCLDPNDYRLAIEGSESAE